MKKIISISLIFMIFLGNILAQNDKKDFSQFYKAYKDKEGVTSIHINSIMKSMLKSGDKNADELMKKTKSMKIITADDPAEGMIKDLENYFPESLYPLLMLVKEGNETVSVKAKQNEKTVEEILFIIKEPNSLTVLCMKGNYNLEDALEMGNSVNFH